MVVVGTRLGERLVFFFSQLFFRNVFKTTPNVDGVNDLNMPSSILSLDQKGHLNNTTIWNLFLHVSVDALQSVINHHQFNYHQFVFVKNHHY